MKNKILAKVNKFTVYLRDRKISVHVSGVALSSSFSEATKPHGSSSDRRHTLLSSQGRCSGLKRKISVSLRF